MGVKITGIKMKRKDDGKEVIPMSESEVLKLREDYAGVVKKLLEHEDRLEKLEAKIK